MPDMYFLSESSGSRKSSLVESLFGSKEPSTFPLSPKLRHDQLVGLNHRRIGQRTSSFSRVHSYLSQLSQSEEDEEDKLTPAHSLKTLLRRSRLTKYRALFLLVGGLFAYQCLSRPTRPVVPSASQSVSQTKPKALPIFSHNDPHPLGKIIQDAQKSWKTIQARQSRTYAEAALEYRRRYKMNPPKGFEKWFFFAKSRGHVLTDEYDSMMEQLSRFRRMDRNELHSRTNSIGKGLGFGLIEMRNGRIHAQIPNNLSYSTYTNNDHENHEFNLKEGKIYTRWATSDKPAHKEIKQTQTWTFSKLIEKITRLDPTIFQDMSLAVNEHFEPRVVIPWETQENSYEDSSRSWDDSRSEDNDNVWSIFRKACPPSSEARKQDDSTEYLVSSIEGKWDDRPQQPGLTEPFLATPVTKSPLGFVTESPAPIKDIYCNSPERRIEQGLFHSNTSKISGLYPVFSQSTAQGFGDIVIPSYLYIRDPYKTREYANEPVTKRARGTSFIAGGQASKLDPNQWKEWDVKWEKKKDQIYWRGLLRDGGDKPGGHQSTFGRHRLVKRFGSSAHSRSESLVWDTCRIKQSIFGSKDTGLSSIVGLGTPNPKMLTKKGLDRSFLNHKTMDVGYLAEDHCGIHEPCQELLKANYRLKMWEPFGAAKFFKWSLDLDGIGFSAKFLNLLQIGTAVVKQTIYREFYSDWLVPWVHYIPLSVEGDELYNVWNYFLGKDNGVFMEKQKQLNKDGWKMINHEKTLKQIAHEASKWSKANAREIDWEIYSYRLLIEWNRIWNSPN
ncbi:hypothetical protein MJO28_010199 [Puccinia striiformis f. sp. tritici]|uniref:Uncharacterized protein n=1 Tax=Puccinia striiformis f. sp. tritici TaxID=168172 RepID=A0ACC0E3U5_9BASI|nr:hypothetical protein Pst134EB_019908 [Puccinia striiformis f. sp. tritici]KAI7944504.1 hypothetical protein MJO28_010199 [Puccinia striiformis f. sp. tritici]